MLIDFLITKILVAVLMNNCIRKKRNMGIPFLFHDFPSLILPLIISEKLRERPLVGDSLPANFS